MMTARTAAALVAAALVSAMALAGCSGAESASPMSAPAGGAADRGAEAAGIPSAQPQTDSGQQAPAQVEPQQRALIYTGSMSVKVDDVVRAANEAADIVTGSGGSIAGDRRSLDGDQS